MTATAGKGMPLPRFCAAAVMVGVGTRNLVKYPLAFLSSTIVAMEAAMNVAPVCPNLSDGRCVEDGDRDNMCRWTECGYTSGLRIVDA